MMLVRYGERSPRVVLIQILLNRAGNTLTVDGVFGPRTRAAVVEFQTAHRIKPDGKVGPDTWRELPRGNNTKVVDVVDFGDPEVGGDAISELRRAGGNPIALGLMCAGVEQMVSSVIGQAGDRGTMALLRITGHGNLGRWMTVSVGDVVDATPEERRVLASESHSYIDPSHVDELAPVLSPLGRYFAPYGMMEHGGCSLGSRLPTRNMMHRLADLWGVPVSAGVGEQASILKFDGHTFTAYPRHGTLQSWSRQFRGASW